MAGFLAAKLVGFVTATNSYVFLETTARASFQS